MKDIPGYEGLYAATEDGRIWSHRTQKFLRPCKTKAGYQTVFLCKGGNGKGKQQRVHRLVAMAYIPNPNNLPHVGHDDENKDNNYISNLYWTDNAENNTHGTRLARVFAKLSKPVRCVELDKVFVSVMGASRELGCRAAEIYNCCNGKKKTYKGFHWVYV